jgi:antirestriction protein ArdC
MGYAKEELRAELSSVFMCQRLGISYELENDQTHIENSVSKKQAYLTLLGIKSNYKVLALNGAHSSSKCNFLPLKKSKIP